MPKMPSPSSELLRIDPLTGCKNYLGFLETLTDHAISDVPNNGRSSGALFKFKINSSDFSAVLFVAMNDIQFLNETKGWAYGDSAIRWMGILLGEESNSGVYRISGLEFAVLFKMRDRQELIHLIERILVRIEREANLLDFPDSAADIALVFLEQMPTSLSSILMIMAEAMLRVKNNAEFHYMVFNVTDFKIHAQAPTKWKANNETDISFAINWISFMNIYQVLEMGKTLDAIQQDAYTDAISGLPNMKAALLNMEQALQNSITNRRPFSILLIDGDNIRIYNNINYAAGDEMIRAMSTVFRNSLRPNDFVARWRSGDEFIAVLPDTPVEGAKIIGERFRLAVKEASQTWMFPITISIGIANYPAHGDTINTLIDKAEAAIKRAKERGKDQVMLAD
jgi:diguanylate cyclase (GGDEF)-like protein